MFYRKNLLAWQQVVRLVLGAALIGVGFTGWLPAPWYYVAMALGAIIAVTGAVGYCPACALVGRRSLPGKGH